MILPKKLLSCLLTIGLLCSCNQTTNKSESESISVLDTVKDYVNLPEFRLSSVLDVVETETRLGYKMKVPYSDTYHITFTENVKKYTIYDYIGNLICESTETFTTPQLEKDEIVYVVIEGNETNHVIQTELYATNHVSVLPYESVFETDPTKLDVYGDSSVNPLKPAKINYKKREGRNLY